MAHRVVVWGHRRNDVGGRRNGRHRDARRQCRAVCRCGTTWSAEFGGSALDHSPRGTRLCGRGIVGTRAPVAGRTSCVNVRQ
jgi:hypothetical protein